MAKLAEPLMDVRNTGKVPNWKVAKSRIVLILVLGKSFALEYLSRDSKFHSKNNTNKLHLLVSSTFSGSKESTKRHVCSFVACKLTTAAPYWGIQFFATNLGLWSVHSKFHEK